MTIVIAIVVALVLAFLAFSFLKGVIKLGTVAILVIMFAFIAHRAGAF
jgi:uncharacterized membrane protein